MRIEVSSAVDFLTKLLRSSGQIGIDRLEYFNVTLTRLICDKYQNHWFPEKPFRGSGFRCLRINHKMEPLILQAAQDSGLTKEQLGTLLPNELTIWIDPDEVSYRIGEDGSVGMIYNAARENNQNNNTTASPLSSSPSPSNSPVYGSPSGSSCSSPRSSPEPVTQSLPSQFFHQQSCKGQMNSNFRHINNEAIHIQRLAAYVYS